MALLARFVPNVILNQPKPFRLVVEIPLPNAYGEASLTYFHINRMNLLTYLLNNWALYAVATDDILYEEVVDDITSGSSIFRLIEQWERTQVFFGYLEALMDYVYFLRAHMAQSMAGAFNPANVHDATRFTADWMDATTVSIYVHPKYEAFV